MTAKSTPRPRKPASLGAAGSALWTRLLEVYIFDAWEMSVVEMACRQADDLARLEAAIKRDGITTVGSQGQSRLAQVVTEARLARLALARLLGQLSLPADTAGGERPLTDKGRRAQRAAEKRWGSSPKLPRGKGADRGETA